MKTRRTKLGSHLFGQAAVTAPRPRRAIRAKYDAIQRTHENRRYYAQADYLSAVAANSPAVRREFRARARYERDNNSYAKGIILTLANYVVGTGPRLQMQLPDKLANRWVEAEFGRWSAAIGLAEKLRTMVQAKITDGESFLLLAGNPRVGPVQLDARLIEADRVADSDIAQLSQTELEDDGIVYDRFGNPQRYRILRRHPGDPWIRPHADSDVMPASRVIHLFRPDRPGQRRGIPEIAPALPLFALLRRYTLAVVGAAEQAALPGGVIHSTAPPIDGESGDVPDPYDTIELERGQWVTMPEGWNISQMKSEQPTTTYPQFKAELLNEIARCLNMPFNIAACNSAGYNYASGRLDHQTFFKSNAIEQSRLIGGVLDPLFRAWLQEAVLIEGYAPQSLRMIGAPDKHTWFWDGLEHVDPKKEADAQAVRLNSCTTTLAEEFGRRGRDWETELEQRALEIQRMRERGLLPTDLVPAGPVAEEDDDDEDEDKDE